MNALIAIDDTPETDEMISTACRLLRDPRIGMTLLHVVPLPNALIYEQPVLVVEGYRNASEQDPSFDDSVRAGATPRLLPRHLVSSGHGWPHNGLLQGHGDLDEQRAHSLRMLARYAKRLIAEGYTHITQDSAIGDPAVVILATAARMDVDIIVVGTHGGSTAHHPLRRSVAQQVTAHAQRPVLVIHQGSRRRDEQLADAELGAVR